VREAAFLDPLAKHIEGDAGEPFRVQIQPRIKRAIFHALTLAYDFSV
jgi:hypothetical protein